MSQGLHVSRAVFLAPAANPAGFVGPFAEQLGLSREVVRLLRARSERRVRFKWDDLDVPAMAHDLSVPLLIFHDQTDQVVPWTNGAAIAEAWTGARLVSTVGLGHRGITSDPEIIGQAVQFITGDSTGGVKAEPAWSASALDRELFRPSERRSVLETF